MIRISLLQKPNRIILIIKMAAVQHSNSNNKFSSDHIHKINWRSSILQQLQLRKTVEENQFKDICSYAGSMFDKVDIYKSENIQLNLRCENLQQQILGIQQTLLAGGSAAAKTVLSKLSSANPGDQANSGGLNQDQSSPAAALAANENLSLQHASLLNEKSQLEKKLFELQEKLADLLKNRSDTMQKVVDLKTEIEEKDRLNRHLTINLAAREKEIDELTANLKDIDSKYKTLGDEHTALLLAYKSIDKRNQQLVIECNALSAQIMAVKREDAERLNAENEKALAIQREKQRLKIEANVAEMTSAQLARQAAGDPSALALAALNRDFELVGVDDESPNFGLPSRIPKKVNFSFEAHDGESCAIDWYYCASPKDAYLATGGADRKVKIWKIGEDSSTLIATLLGSNKSILSIDVESDFILASSNDMATRIWSLNGYSLKQTLTGHSDKVYTAKFLGSKHKVASGSHDRTVKVWDVNQGIIFKTYFVSSCCFDLVHNNHQIMSCHFDSKIRCWAFNQPDNSEPTAQIVLQSRITSLDISSDGTKLLCSVRDNTIKLLDIRKMEVIQTYSDEKFRIGTDNVRAKFSVDGQYISCGSYDGSIYIWNVNTAKVEKVLTGHTSTVVASSWSPDGERMVSIERGRKVNIWF